MNYLLPSTLAVLEFTSLPMLGWLAAAVVPWLIHRWFRRQHQISEWAAVDLLLRAMRQRGRQVQLQQWLLLAVRTIILALVGLAAAEPVWRQWSVGVDPRSQMHQVLVVDQSFSMDCRQDGSSRWRSAKTHARSWIENNAGDSYTIIGWSEETDNLLGRPTFDNALVLGVLDELELTQARADLRTVLPAVQAAIDRAESIFPWVDEHQIVFFTDLGRQTWTIDRKRRELLESVAKRAKVTLVNVASRAATNVAITDLRIEPTVTLLQREAAIFAKVHCFGEPESPTAKVELRVEGERTAQQELELRKDDVATVRFTHRFVDQGAYSIRVALVEHADGLPMDDQRWLVANVLPKIRVACFAGQLGAIDDIARALAPEADSQSDDQVFVSEVLAANQLGEIDLSEYDGVILGSFTELSAREAVGLTDYVRRGGALAVFLGPSADAEIYGELQQLLPVEIGARSTAGEYRFDPLQYSHPIVSPFRGQSQSGLLGVAISQYRQLKFNEELHSGDVVMAFSTGEPALVVGRSDFGRVAVFALPGSLTVRTQAGVPLSSFALSPSFLPVVRELMLHLVGDRLTERRNILVGQTAEFYVSPGTRNITLRQPDGNQQAISTFDAVESGKILFTEAAEQGIYHYEERGEELARVAVNLDPRESDLSSVDVSELPTSLLGNSVEAFVASTPVGRNVLFARMLLTIAVFLLLLEIGLAWLLGRGWG